MTLLQHRRKRPPMTDNTKTTYASTAVCSVLVFRPSQYLSNSTCVPPGSQVPFPKAHLVPECTNTPRTRLYISPQIVFLALPFAPHVLTDRCWPSKVAQTSSLMWGLHPELKMPPQKWCKFRTWKNQQGFMSVLRQQRPVIIRLSVLFTCRKGRNQEIRDVQDSDRAGIHRQQ